jgi:hypothetical protein
MEIQKIILAIFIVFNLVSMDTGCNESRKLVFKKIHADYAKMQKRKEQRERQRLWRNERRRANEELQKKYWSSLVLIKKEAAIGLSGDFCSEMRG